MEAILSSETSIYTISTRRHIPEDSSLHASTIIRELRYLRTSVLIQICTHEDITSRLISRNASVQHHLPFVPP
jgi:hypothetical protein